MFQRCTFSPFNEYVNPIAPPELLTATVEVNNSDFADPYYILLPTTFRFTIEAEKPVIDYIIKIDGTEIAQGTDRNISFFLFPHSIPEGNHLVTISVRIATQSGSLAEILNAEYYLLEKSFRLINDRTPPPNVTATASYENGHLTVRWNKLNQKNFYYVIKRTYSTYDQLNDTIINNPGQDKFIDRGYVGGDITYRITATGFGFEQHVLGSITFLDNPVDFRVSLDTNQKTVRLNWTNSNIDVANTTVKIETDGRNIILPLTSSNELVIDTLTLGEERNYWIETQRTGYSRQKYTRIEGTKHPPSIKPFITQAFLVDQNKLLTLTPKAIYRYALPSFMLEDSLPSSVDGNFYDMAISDDGNQAVIVTDNWSLYGFDPMAFEEPITNHQLFDATIAATFTNAPFEKVDLGNISENGVLTMVLSKSGAQTQIVFNISTQAVLWNGPSFIYLNNMYPPVISPNGLYLANDYPGLETADIYTWSGNSFDKIGTTAQGRKYFRANTSELINGTVKEDIFRISSGELTIYDTNTPSQPNQPLTTLRSMNFSSTLGDEYFWELRYDDNTHLFYTRHMGNVFSTLRLYDVNSMSFVGSLKAFTYTPYSHEFVNGFHFTNRGYIEQRK